MENNIQRRNLDQLNYDLEDLKELSEDLRLMEKIWDERGRLESGYSSEEDLEPIPEEILNQLGYKFWKD